MADAANFDVTYVINPHMAGNIGTVDTGLAQRQWQALHDAYLALGLTVDVLESVPGLPDLVFMANQSFPAILDGKLAALMSFMHAEERQPEVEVVASWYASQGARRLLQEAPPIPFEGMGDAHWFPDRQLVIGGFGFRSARQIYNSIASAVGVDVVCLELTDARFYHLDTCLAPLDSRTALFVPEAFTPTGIALIERLFERLLPVPMNEAAQLLACNGHCPDRKHFLVQAGATETNRAVRDAGYAVIELDTSEYLKSGGSVFCMKLMLPG